jgi:hypothetical protein
MNWFTDHLTKILGTAQTLVAAVLGAVATNQIPDIIAQDSRGMQWLILANILLGAVTVGVGFNNSAKAKVAAAMQDAINAQPPEKV